NASDGGAGASTHCPVSMGMNPLLWLDFDMAIQPSLWSQDVIGDGSNITVDIRQAHCGLRALHAHLPAHPSATKETAQLYGRMPDSASSDLYLRMYYFAPSNFSTDLFDVRVSDTGPTTAFAIAADGAFQIFSDLPSATTGSSFDKHYAR